jgi:hypothetical protein
MYTIIANDMGKKVALGTAGAGVNKYYCGLYVGMKELPESDGYCGPVDGPPCFSCERFAGGVSEEHKELAALRAVEAQCKKNLARADRQRREQEVALRRELETEKRLVRGLEADKRASEQRIHALEARAGIGQKRIHELEAGATGDEWTRMCDDKTVCPVLYKFIVDRGFHPDKNTGHAEQAKFEAFFKMASDKNDAFTGKGPSAETTAREERAVAASVERETRDQREAKQQKTEAKPQKTVGEGHRMSAELLESLVQYGLESEEKWLREMVVFDFQDFEFLNDLSAAGACMLTAHT